MDGASSSELAVSIRFILDRQNEAAREPNGTWKQRFIPFYCNHESLRCVHGDERNQTRSYVVCRDCGRPLPKYTLPDVCFFTGAPHSRPKD